MDIFPVSIRFFNCHIRQKILTNPSLFAAPETLSLVNCWDNSIGISDRFPCPPLISNIHSKYCFLNAQLGYKNVKWTTYHNKNVHKVHIHLIKKKHNKWWKKMCLYSINTAQVKDFLSEKSQRSNLLCVRIKIGEDIISIHYIIMLVYNQYLISVLSVLRANFLFSKVNKVLSYQYHLNFFLRFSLRWIFLIFDKKIRWIFYRSRFTPIIIILFLFVVEWELFIRTMTFSSL